MVLNPVTSPLSYFNWAFPFLKICSLKKKSIYLFIFGERGREGEREGNINMWLPLARPLLGTWPATQACALTGVESATFGSQAGAQSTEPHQPGLEICSVDILTHIK